MADYSVNATNLSAPSGAGSQPVAAVQQTYVPPVSQQQLSVLDNVVDIFNKGLTESRKQDAENAKNAVIGNFVNDQNAISQAVASGSMKPAEAAARQRSLSAQYFSGYPQYIKDFQTANEGLKAQTEKGVIENIVEDERKQKNAIIEKANAAGYTITSGMSEETQNTLINSYQQSQRLKDQMEDLRKQAQEQRAVNAEGRAQAAEGRTVKNEALQEQSTMLLTQLGGTQMDGFAAAGRDLQERFRAGKITLDEARLEQQKRFANIQQAIQATAGVNPSLAAPWMSQFNQMNEVIMKGLDPNANVQELENQYKTIVGNAKLMAVTNNKDLLAMAAISQIAPNSQILRVEKAAQEAFMWMTQQDLSKGYKPNVVGTGTSAETSLFSLGNGAIDKLNGPEVKNKVQGGKEADNLVNNVLQQTGFLSDTRQATPENLKQVATWLSGPQVASRIKNGTIDVATREAAKRAFQINYEPAVVKSINNKLDENIPGATGEKYSSLINFKYTGAGVVFEAQPDKVQNGFVGGLVTKQQTLENIKGAQVALNQLIRLGAHMEGSTDYQKYWEDNKHLLLPKVFPDPALLKPGQVVGDHRYNGGPVSNQNSWTLVKRPLESGGAITTAGK